MFEDIGERTTFDNLASTYDKTFFTPDNKISYKRYHKLLALVRPYLSISNPYQVLEIGCGTGIYTENLVKEEKFTVTATDISKNMLCIARDRISDGKVRYLQCQAEALSFSASSFDLVVAFGCLHHIADTQSVFQQISRILKPNGHFLMMEPNPLNSVNFLISLVKPIERGMRHSWPRRWNRESENAKFNLVSFKSGSFFPSWPYWLTHTYNKIEPIMERAFGIKHLAIFYYYDFAKMN